MSSVVCFDKLIQNFTHVFTSFGNCWTFNLGIDVPILKEAQAGSGNGLKLLIDIQQVLHLFICLILFLFLTLVNIFVITLQLKGEHDKKQS